MPKKSTKKSAAKSVPAVDNSHLSVAIKIDLEEPNADHSYELVRVRAVEFDDNGISKSKGFDEKVFPFSAKLAAKFVDFVGTRKTYSDMPMATHMWNGALRSVAVKPLEPSIYAYDYFKQLHPKIKSDAANGQHSLAQIVKEYPVAKAEGAHALATAIMSLRAALAKTGVSLDKFESDILAKKAKRKPSAKHVDEKDDTATAKRKHAAAPDASSKKLKATPTAKDEKAAASALVSMGMFKPVAANDTVAPKPMKIIKKRFK